MKRAEEDNTYLSYNKVIGTALDEKLYLAFEILDYALSVRTGRTAEESTCWMQESARISQASYDNGVYQPIFSVIAKNANAEQKEEFVRVIRRYIERYCEKWNQ